MEELLNKLYSYEYFGIYLMISIIVLIALFIIILFFGKKDQKEREIEATKKLQQINNDAFKDDSLEQKLEIENVTKEQLENDTIAVPTIEDVPSIMATSDNEIPEPVLPIQEAMPAESNNSVEPVAEISLETPVEDIPVVDIPVIETPVVEQEKEEETAPLLEKVEEKPLIFNDFSLDMPSVPEDVQVEPIAPVVEQETEEEIEVPTFNFDEILQGVEETKKEQTYTKGPEIFSSVYVPEKEVEDTPATEEPVVKASVQEELEFELPTLKKDVIEEQKQEEVKEEIEVPELNDYNLDELFGETYTINK